MHGIKYKLCAQDLCDLKSANLMYDWMEKLEKRQDCYEVVYQLTTNWLNFMQTDLTNFWKAIHEFLAIVKQIAIRGKIPFGCEVELIS